VATFLALLLVALLPCAASAETRVALVVGAGAYRTVPALDNPPNDARDMGAILTRLNFDTETVIDPDRFTLEAALRRLGRKAPTADVALFFYAGHALEAEGHNWLLPVSTELKSALDLRFEAIDVDAVTEQMSQARLKLLFLDSCRDNPFTARLTAAGRGIQMARGLAEIIAPVGTLVVFSTAPGTLALDGQGRNSPFTRALLANLPRPGVEVRAMLNDVRRAVREATDGRQVPWDNSSLEGDFFFVPPPPPPAAPPIAPVSRPAADDERLFWDSVRNSDDPRDLDAFLVQFPNGVFAALARNRLDRLRAAPRPEAGLPTFGNGGGPIAPPPPLARPEVVRPDDARPAREATTSPPAVEPAAPVPAREPPPRPSAPDAAARPTIHPPVTPPAAPPRPTVARAPRVEARPPAAAAPAQQAPTAPSSQTNAPPAPAQARDPTSRFR
jgi:hypothetical protein